MRSKWTFILVAWLSIAGHCAANPGPAIRSFGTGYTITLVRTGLINGRSVIVGASYEGTILALDYEGRMLWKRPNPLTGHMVRDLWCGDLDRDGTDEVLAAVSDGSVHCLNLADGSPRWARPFQPNEVPMNAVCTVRTSPTSTAVACGGFDKNLYYLDSNGRLLQTIGSSTYSDLHPWGKDRWHLGRPVGNAHVANFLRPVPQPDGTDHLMLLGMQNHMQVSGKLYEFEPLAAKPIKAYDIPYNRPIGHLSVIGPMAEGGCRLLLGSSALGNDHGIEIDLTRGTSRFHVLRGIGPNGYRVTQAEVIPSGDSHQYLFLCGTHIVLLPDDFDGNKKETLAGHYAYNDLWRDRTNDRLLLASSQSGGSAIHVIDTKNPGWKAGFQNLEPPGKIQTIKRNLEATREQLARFKKAAWERSPDQVLFSAADPDQPVAARLIQAGHTNVAFFHGRRTVPWNHVEKRDWRDQPGTRLRSEPARNARDKRMKYVLSQQEAVESFMPAFEHPGSAGASIWAGHGNDLFYYQPDTYRRIMDAAHGKYTLLTFPEVGGRLPDLDYLMDEIFYPLAQYAQTRNGRIVLRNKNIYFQSAVYQPYWRRLISGDFKDVFISSMEETTDKTQDMSLAGRIGLWASGCMDVWGMRTSRDNPSFDRSRQHSYQKLPTHFLRAAVYSLAYGARYTQNTYTDEHTMSLLWELVAKGALFVPRREEIVSFSPVHFSITEPDERYVEEGENVKWTVFYDADDEAANPMVFSRMNGTWMAAKPTPWDYSTIAHGAKERRQEFLPTFEKGLVLITPVENGIHAAPARHRKRLVENLHPLYRNILKEHITNGRDYLESNSDKAYPANGSYYRTVARDIERGAEQLPLTVSGGVAWVCAQTATNHLRLTLVDSGYLNPQQRTARVEFHTVRPVRLRDVLSDEAIQFSDSSKVSIEVPLGLFRFIDVEFDGKLTARKNER